MVARKIRKIATIQKAGATGRQAGFAGGNPCPLLLGCRGEFFGKKLSSMSSFTGGGGL